MITTIFKSILTLIAIMHLPCALAERLDLPDDYVLHADDSSYIPHRNLDNYTLFHSVRAEKKEMLLHLPEGTINTYDTAGVRVEGFTPKPWKSYAENQWFAWEGTYRVEKAGCSDRGYAIFQMKSIDVAVKWEVQIFVDTDANVVLNHRRNRDFILGKNIEGKEFRIKVASNGRRYKVWYNGDLKTDARHQMDPTGDSSYAWRWGIYKSEETRNTETSTLALFNIRYGLSDENGQLIPDADKDGISDVEEGNQDNDGDGIPNYLDPYSNGTDLPDSESIAQLRLACDNAFRVKMNGELIGAGSCWNKASIYKIRLRRGRNLLEVACKNDGSYGGLLADISTPNKKVATSSAWEISSDNINWIPATEYGNYGSNPWGFQIEGMPRDVKSKWIWSNNRKSLNTVYFRHELEY